MEHKVKIKCHGCEQKLDVTELEPFSKVDCPECRTELIIPVPFDNYVLEELIGYSCMTAVYRAMDLTLDREICVKVLQPDLAADADLTKAFIDEASRASAVSHPNIVPIYSCGEVAAQPFIVRQYMEGYSIADKLDGTTHIAQDVVCRWFVDIAKGLEAADGQELHHGNLCPENILFDADHKIKVSDFGLAKLLLKKEALIDQHDALVDSHAVMYLSPEVISTTRQDVRGDIYSLGACMYHVLSQQIPFPGESAGAVMNARFRGPPESMRERRPDIVEDLDALVTRLMAVYPKDRPSDYCEVVGALVAILETELPPPGPVVGVAANDIDLAPQQCKIEIAPVGQDIQLAPSQDGADQPDEVKKKKKKKKLMGTTARKKRPIVSAAKKVPKKKMSMTRKPKAIPANPEDADSDGADD